MAKATTKKKAAPAAKASAATAPAPAPAPTVNLVLLANIVRATQSADGFDYVAPSHELTTLAGLGLVMVDNAYTNNFGHPAVAASAEGVAYLNHSGYVAPVENSQPAPVTATQENAMSPNTDFMVFDSIGTLPPRSRGVGAPRESRYPFDSLAVGAALYFPDTATEKAVKKYASLASSATRRYSSERKDANGNTIYKLETRNETILDDNGNPIIGPDGKKVTRHVQKQIAERDYSRRFSIRPCPDGHELPNGQKLTAGAFIVREQ